MTDTTDKTGGGGYSLVRIGGGLMLVSMAIHVAANFFLKQMPSPDLTPQELGVYLEAEHGTWAIVHGMRYVAMVGMAVFYAGLFVFTGARRDGIAGWEVVGLVGGILHVANLLIANGLEMLAFGDFDSLSRNAELFWLAYSASRMLFDAELITWAIAMIGFGVAGWRTRALPVWLAGIGFLSAACAIVSSVFVYSMLSGGWAGMVVEIASVAGLIWFLGVGVVMVVRER